VKGADLGALFHELIRFETVLRAAVDARLQPIGSKRTRTVGEGRTLDQLHATLRKLRAAQGQPATIAGARQAPSTAVPRGGAS
jgi:hypothetical protein